MASLPSRRRTARAELDVRELLPAGELVGGPHLAALLVRHDLDTRPRGPRSDVNEPRWNAVVELTSKLSRTTGSAGSRPGLRAASERHCTPALDPSDAAAEPPIESPTSESRCHFLVLLRQIPSTRGPSGRARPRAGHASALRRIRRPGASCSSRELARGSSRARGRAATAVAAPPRWPPMTMDDRLGGSWSMHAGRPARGGRGRSGAKGAAWSAAEPFVPGAVHVPAARPTRRHAAASGADCVCGRASGSG